RHRQRHYPNQRRHESHFLSRKQKWKRSLRACWTMGCRPRSLNLTSQAEGPLEATIDCAPKLPRKEMRLRVSVHPPLPQRSPNTPPADRRHIPPLRDWKRPSGTATPSSGST
ncbi:hypothetical protein LTR94_032293, partial [Friedmanniomyces endolithicus]